MLMGLLIDKEINFLSILRTLPHSQSSSFRVSGGEASTYSHSLLAFLTVLYMVLRNSFKKQVYMYYECLHTYACISCVRDGAVETGRPPSSWEAVGEGREGMPRVFLGSFIQSGLG